VTVRLGLLTAAAVGLLVAGCGGSHVNRRPTETELLRVAIRHNKRAALASARSEFAALKLPPGASPTTSEVGLGAGLTAPADQPFQPNQLDVTRFWHLPGRPSAAISWLETHGPRQADIHGFNAGGLFTTFILAPSPGSIWRELSLSAAPAGHGDTVLRADSEAMWEMPRSDNTFISGEVTAIRVTKRDQLTDYRKTRLIRTASEIERIVALLNALPTYQDLRPCAVNHQAEITLTLSQPDAPRSTVASFSGCGQVMVSGRVSVPLVSNLPNWNNRPYLAVLRQIDPTYMTRHSFYAGWGSPSIRRYW
jgi:hypothetical protein